MKLYKMSRKKDKIYKKESNKMNLHEKIINKIMKNGKKNQAREIFLKSSKNLENIFKKEKNDVLEKTIKNLTPTVELKSRRVGGATYKIPIEIKEERGINLAISFLIKAARKRSGKSIISKLENEIIDAYNNTGNAIRKKEELHKTAETNKAFTNLK